MTNDILKATKQVIDIYRSKIKPDNRGWNVLSIESAYTSKYEETYRAFGVGNDYNVFDILKGNEIPNKDWDLIIIGDTIQHIFDFNHLINICFNILKPGGFMIIYSPFIQEYTGNEKMNDYWRISHKALQRILNDVGFEYGNCGLIDGCLTSAIARKGKEDIDG